MKTPRRPTVEPPQNHALEAERLQQRAAEYPGVAELLRLYEQHAALVRQAGTYGPRNASVIIASGNATA